MNNILFHLVLLAYLIATLLFWMHLGLRQPWLLRVANALVGGGVVLQSGLLAYRLLLQVVLGGIAVATPMALLSWAIVVVYLAAWWSYRIEALGSFVMPLAFLAVAYSGVPETKSELLAPAFQRLWLGTHIFLAVLGYAALSLTFCAGLMYHLQEWQLKSKRPGHLSARLPSLNLLDTLNARTLLIGFPLLTQGIITGSVWAKYMHGSYFQWSEKSLPLLLAWLLYALLMGGRRTLGWQGRKAASAAIGGFVVVVASYFVHTW